MNKNLSHSKWSLIGLAITLLILIGPSLVSWLFISSDVKYIVTASITFGLSVVYYVALLLTPRVPKVLFVWANILILFALLGLFVTLAGNWFGNGFTF